MSHHRAKPIVSRRAFLMGGLGVVAGADRHMAALAGELALRVNSKHARPLRLVV